MLWTNSAIYERRKMSSTAKYLNRDVEEIGVCENCTCIVLPSSDRRDG